MKHYGIIYKVTNAANGKVYIGQTVQRLACLRWSGHLSAARKGVKTPLHRAIRKYGKESFYVETVAVCFDRESLDKAERKIIEQYCSLAPIGYNLQTGGNGFRHHEGTKAKFKGRTSPTKGRPSPLKGQARPAHVVAKIIANKTDRRPIRDDAGNEYASIADAARTLNITRRSLFNHLQNKVQNPRFFYKD